MSGEEETDTEVSAEATEGAEGDAEVAPEEAGADGEEGESSGDEVLSEGELDALMDSISGEDVEPGSGAAPGEYQAFDFTTREQTLLARMPALKKINERHSLALAQSIAELYGFSAEVEMTEVKLLKLDQALAAIAEPSAINLVKITPLTGVSYVVLPGELLSHFVDLYFGGAGTSNTAEPVARTALTPTELRINEVLCEHFLKTLVDAWSEKIGLSTQLAGFESKATYLQANSPDELALVFPFTVTLGEWSASIDWIAPYAALEPLRQKLGSLAVEEKSTPKNSDWEQHFLRELQNVTLDVSGRFESGPVSIAEVLALKPGVIVPLKMPSDVTFCIENNVFSLGEHGVLNGNKSIKIKEFISHDAS